MRKVLFLAFLFVGCFSLYHFLSSQFRFANIYFDPVYESTIRPSQEKNSEMQHILSQTFTYLDRGHQSFVFMSQDRRYVLKFFDAKRLRPSLFSSKKKIRLKMQRLFEGYEVAYLRDQANTGVLYAKLGFDPLLDKPVHCIDQFGMHHTIALQEVPFVIQKAALPTRVLISQILDRNEIEAAKGYFRKIIAMYVDEYQKGIYDRDRNFMYNTGFVEDRPLRMDAGRLMFNEHFKEVDLSKDLEKIVIRRARKWLQRHYPAQAEEIMSDLHNAIEPVAKLICPAKSPFLGQLRPFSSANPKG